MDNNMYTEALNRALTEIRNISPSIKHSFLLSEEGSILAKDEKIDETMAQKLVQSLEEIMEKTTAINGLESYLIEGENGKVCFSRIDNMYLTMVTTKNADLASLQSTTRLIIPTILRLFESLTPTPSAKLPELNKPSELVVETFAASNFMTRFSGETIQVDRELLEEWNKSFEGKVVGEIQIETPNGKTAVYRVKAINDPQVKREGTIRIPNKTCKTLGIRSGQTVSVKPIKASTATQNLTYRLRTS